MNVGAFPIGIEPKRFIKTLGTDSVRERIAELESEFEGKKVMVGVDRLDYIKGIPQKLRAFEIFLNDHPECVGSVVLIQIAVPTRGDVEEYQNLRALVNELIGRINGRFGKTLPISTTWNGGKPSARTLITSVGTFEYMPIHFMHQSVPFQELLALYAISEVCIVSSTRDGMNLVSFEYIACQRERHGSLILSEFAGSAKSLSGSIVVNPWNVYEMARAIDIAYHMPEEERRERFGKMDDHVQKFTRSAPT